MQSDRLKDRQTDNRQTGKHKKCTVHRVCVLFFPGIVTEGDATLAGRNLICVH
jgi:hypothetical protein